MDRLADILDRYHLTLDGGAIAALPEHDAINLREDLTRIVDALPTPEDFTDADLETARGIETALELLDQAHGGKPLAASAGGAPAEPPAPPPIARRVEARNATKPVARPAVRAGSVLRSSAGRAVEPDSLLALVGQGLRDLSRGYAASGRNYGDGLVRLATVEAVPGPYQLGYDARENVKVIRASADAHERALRASGGICAPPPVKYDLPQLPVTSRPVKDALVPLDAPRGGYRILRGPELADVASGIGVWTHDNDVNPSNPSTKNIVTLDCPDEIEVIVDAITMRLQLGNYAAMYQTELVARWVATLEAAHARAAELNLLAGIDGDATVTTFGGQLLGTARDVLTNLDRAGAHLRYRGRLAPGATLTAILPAWCREEIRTDLAREQPGATAERLAVSDGQVDGFFTARSIAPVWSLDAGALPSSQADNVGLNPWPSHVVVRLFPSQGVAFVDGGELNLGIVRDTTLNATNDCELFAETFENVLRLAGELLVIDIDICPSGETAAPISTSGICSQGS